MRSRKVEGNIPNIASVIDNTLLRPDATESDILQFCKESIGKGFATLCVHPCWVAILKDNSKERLCTAIGFPFGADKMETKLREVEIAIKDGADELDMVMNIGKFKSNDYKYVQNEIEGIVGISGGKIVKVIIETCYLTNREIKNASLLVVDSGAAFVKTSTGFGPRGATVEDIKLMRKSVGARIQVKASGGIRTLETTIAMIKAGAARIGTSSGLKIIEEFHEANKVSKTISN